MPRKLPFENGDLFLHRTPGLGFRFNESAVKQYALSKARPWTVVR